MGAQLDVLIGHPEHDLLFIATQVGRLAGLKNPSNIASVTAKAEGRRRHKVWVDRSTKFQ